MPTATHPIGECQCILAQFLILVSIHMAHHSLMGPVSSLVITLGVCAEHILISCSCMQAVPLPGPANASWGDCIVWRA